jgi:phospholipid/cholesterol/gamma-HCH transport system substrate-binding protein
MREVVDGIKKLSHPEEAAQRLSRRTHRAGPFFHALLRGNDAVIARMPGNVIETVMGGVVLVVAALFLFFAYSTSQVRAVQGYQVTAQFERVGSLRDGGDVRIAGVKIGSIVSETLDPKTFLADVRMSIDPAYKLPDDTVAEIVSNGLLGDQYMALVPGGSDQTIPPGGRIKFTQSPVSLENLIGQMIFSQPGAQKKPEEGEAPSK